MDFLTFHLGQCTPWGELTLDLPSTESTFLLKNHRIQTFILAFDWNLHKESFKLYESANCTWNVLHRVCACKTNLCCYVRLWVERYQVSGWVWPYTYVFVGIARSSPVQIFLLDDYLACSSKLCYIWNIATAISFVHLPLKQITFW